MKRMSAFTAGSGQNLVLFHGGFGSWTHWIKNVEALALRFRVIAFDLPGYGESPSVPNETSADQYVEYVADAIAAAVPGNFHLAGFSFGGALAARVAVQLGSRIRRISLLGPSGFGNPLERTITLMKLPSRDASMIERRRVVAINLGRWMLSSTPSPDDPVIDIQLANIDRTRYDSRGVSLRETLVKDVARISAPIQVIWGASDKMAYPTVQSRADSCRESRIDLGMAVVPGGGHWVQYEQPEAVNRLLIDFHEK